MSSWHCRSSRSYSTIRPLTGLLTSRYHQQCRSHNRGYLTSSRYLLPFASRFPIALPCHKPLIPVLQVQCRIFSQTYNPLRLRTGNRVLRQRLRGPSVAAYYPRRVATIKDLKNAYKHFDEEMETWDDDEEDRLEHLALAKQRGKGAPKKKRTAEGESVHT